MTSNGSFFKLFKQSFIHPVHAFWFGLHPEGAGFGCIRMWAEGKGKPKSELWGNIGRRHKTTWRLNFTALYKVREGCRARSHVWGHVLGGGRGSAGLWRCSQLCLWAGKRLTPAQRCHSFHIHLLSDSHVSHTLFLDEFTVRLYYIEVTRHSLRMRGLELAACLR